MSGGGSCNAPHYPEGKIMRLRSRHVASLFVALAVALPALFTGCGDDNNPADPGNGDGDTTTVSAGRGTIDSLLSQFFPEVYSNRKYDAYAKMLDSRYQFRKLADFPGQFDNERIWDRDEELSIARVMFDGTANANRQSVESITLNINVGSTTPSDHADEPGNEEWFDVVAIVDMTVVISDPTQDDGTGILNLLVDSNQNFVVTEDADSPGDWVVVRQEDRSSIEKSVPGDGATEETSWGAIKDLFRVAASGRNTIDELIEEHFPEVYERRLYADYANMLDPRYTFQKLPDDPDQPVSELFWDKSEELQITERMFDGVPNLSGQRVKSISLNIQNGDISPSLDTDQGPGEEWFDVRSIIDLTVVLHEPSQSDGTGILNLLIDSEQKFIVTADPDSPNDWVIVKQEDQQSIGKAGGSGATEEASWSDVKGLFR